jgi:type IV pilus assembly protein PilQ
MKITHNISIKPFQELEMSNRTDHKTLMYVKLACLAAITLTAVVTLPIQAADAPAADQAAPTPAPTVEQVAAPATAVEQPVAVVKPAVKRSVTDIMTLNFTSGTTVREALNYLGQTYQKNIIPSSKIEGTVTISSLRDVTFDQAIKAILGNRFAYEPSDGDIYVYTVEEIKTIKEDPKRLQTKVFTLSYISAEDAKLFLEPVASSATECKDCKMVASIKAETKSSGGSAGGGASVQLTASTSGIKDASNDMLIVKDYPEKLDAIAAKLKELDTRPQQVLVEATILAVTLTEDTQFGIDWNTINGVAISGIITAATKGGMATSGFAPSLTKGVTVGITGDSVKAIITALETTTDVTVMANPKVLAVNKQRGQVFIGREEGYQGATQSDGSGGKIAGTVEQLKTGTSLEFTPYVGTDGYIRMDIFPEDSSGSINASGLPDKRTTTVTSNIMVKDGQTVVIGGLIRNNTITTKSQIPLLGDLPLIGIVFRGSQDTTIKQEVIFMLTPHIIKSPSDAAADTAKADIENKTEGARKEMQWFSRSRVAEDHYQNAMKAYNSGNMRTALSEVRFALWFRPAYTEAMRLEKMILSQGDKKADNTSMEKVMQTL